MNAFTVCAVGIIASLLAIVLKKNNSEYSFALVVCTSAIIITYITGAVIDSVSKVSELFSESGMSVTYLTILLKCVGICFLTEFTCDACKDAGQASLSNIVLFSGKIFVLITAFPLFSQLFSMVSDLSGG